jgi:predicted O-methyltransferase YrrM
MYGLSVLKEGDVCCEVGVWKGDTSRYILNKNPSELHLVDPWMATDRPNRMYHISQEEMDDIYKSVVNNFKNDPRVTIYRKPSSEVEFTENYFDWVFIDGQHRYDEVLFDLRRFLDCVKSGGWIIGDDYTWKDPDDKGIVQAVKDFCKESGQTYKVVDGNRFAIQVKK